MKMRLYALNLIFCTLICVSVIPEVKGTMCAYAISATLCKMFVPGIPLLVPGISAVKIGILGVYYDDTYNDFMSLHHTGSAINIANDKLIEDGVVNETLSVVWPLRDTYLQSDGVGNVVELVRNRDVDVIFGSPSSRITEPAASLTSHWNVPHLSWAANSYELGNKTLFQTFLRSSGPISEVGKALVTLFKAMGWNKIGFMYIDYGICKYVAMGTRTEVTKNNMTEIQTLSYTFDTVVTDAMVDNYLRVLRRTSRIIFICVDALLRRFLLRACKYNDMCNGDFLFVTSGLETPTASIWSAGDADDLEVKKAFRYLFYAARATYMGDDGYRRLKKFEVDVIERMSEKPWYSQVAKRNNMTTDRNAQYLYDATYFYGLWLNHSRHHGIDIRDGRAMIDFSKHLSFQGLSGSCDFGDNGDRIPDMWIYQFLYGTPEIVAIAETTRNVIQETIGFQWYTSDNLPPVDTPVCGYLNELCIQEPENDSNTVLLLVVLFTSFVVVMATVGTAYTVRKRQIENAMIQSIWKVDINDLELLTFATGGGSRLHVKSSTAFDKGSKASTPVVMPSQTKVGMLLGQEVVIRNVSRSANAVLSRNDMIQLKTMRQLVHDNINPFIGATFDIASPCAIFLFCRKGSLQDVLDNDDVQLDSLFKLSMTLDIIHGMLFIHSSKLGCHGRLKSSNCLVDGRWAVKITDYGLNRFMDNKKAADKREENEKYKSLLWTAPELLDDPRNSGTKEGDVYSFAIILHEIFCRQGTFAGKGHLTDREIVEKVRRRESVPCRPELLSDDMDLSPHVIRLMTDCWHDNEFERPSFKMINIFFKQKMKVRNANIVDVAMQRLEKYAANLENIVEERTHQLIHEKRKADKLLYRMLPPSCAEQLKTGEVVRPEIFDSATVFFSDIVGFTTICARSTPIEVVNLLNDLYSFFDDIIERHDAYKVETIGDAYLVVSGVPQRNGNLHAGIIADMSLDISHGVNAFKMKHLPEEKIMVRIGLHTGPCCAGVVGLSMPRYCVFGDTINTASRMESNGERQKIHISEATKEALHILGGFRTTFRGEIPIKGKGQMRTYWLSGRGGSDPGRVFKCV